jgi:hypothetical protein
MQSEDILLLCMRLLSNIAYFLSCIEDAAVV